jgi:hypothetical protein
MIAFHLKVTMHPVRLSTLLSMTGQSHEAMPLLPADRGKQPVGEQMFTIYVIVTTTRGYLQPLSEVPHPVVLDVNSQSLQKKVYASQYGPFGIVRVVNTAHTLMSPVSRQLLIRFIVNYLLLIN